MVVEPLNAAIADSAVDCPWWSVDVTGHTVFDLGQSGIDHVQVFAPVLHIHLIDRSLESLEQKSSHWNSCWVFSGRQHQENTRDHLHHQAEDEQHPD